MSNMKEAQDLHKRLMAIRADFDDLCKKLDKWGKDFFCAFKKSEAKLEGEDNGHPGNSDTD